MERPRAIRAALALGFAAMQPLHDVRVLDFTQNLPGPYATFLLASWGADVVKVEPPKGDPGRGIEPFFSMVNRDKRSVVLDLRDPASRPALEALVRWADVLVEGFRPGVMDRLGCGYEVARALNPRLVYCSISAFGQQGPLRDHPGHDLDLQALSGVCWMERDDADAPRGAALPVADLSSALLAVSAICGALLARGPEGPGARLDVAMADGVLSWANLWGLGVDMTAPARAALAQAPAVGGLAAPLLAALERRRLYALPHYQVYETRDGRWLSVGVVDEDHFWRALCEELGLGALRRLPMPARLVGGPALRRLFARRFRRRTLDEWLRRLRARGVPSAPVRTPAEAAREPQVAARGFGGPWRGSPWMSAPLPGARPPRTEAPARGAHTEEVLAALGVDPR